MASYAHLSREELIDRLQRLESVHGVPGPLERAGKRPFDFQSYPRRKIALKFCYWGSDYSGLAIQDGPTPLPTVESVLFAALAKSRLVDPDAGLNGCGWSRCGRTDRGVSAAGQVISLWVRSNIGKRKPAPAISSPTNATADFPQDDAALPLDLSLPAEIEDVTREPEPEVQELRYVHSLNQNLPPTIRVLAWSPVAEDFDARFSCAYRHYKYIFTSGTSPRLNIDAMKDAAARLCGEHDFRNFCKQDPTKQIENFYRRILTATITPLDPDSNSDVSPCLSDQASSLSGQTDTRFVFDLVGTAFLYHQVRHIMAILFLIGSGHESPDIIDTLFNTGVEPPNEIPRRIADPLIPALNVPLPPPSSGSDPNLPIVATKPTYRMADALPLILWDCGYADSDVQWRAEDIASSPPKDHASSLYHEMQASLTRDVINTSVSSLFLQAAAPFHAPAPTPSLAQTPQPVRYHLGGGVVHTEPKYIPLLDRPRGGSIADANAKWRDGAKGKRNSEKMARRAEERERERAAVAANALASGGVAEAVAAVDDLTMDI